MAMIRCKTCKHFDDLGANDLGFCRMNPPKTDVINAMGLWPRVNGERDWCGSYEAARVSTKKKAKV